MTATYGGDHDFAASSGALTRIVRFPTAIELSVRPEPSTFSQPFTVLVRVHSAAPGTPTGLVQLSADATRVGEVALKDGLAELTELQLPTGERTVVAQYQGDSYLAPSSGATTHCVERASTTTTLRSSPGSDGANPG